MKATGKKEKTNIELLREIRDKISLEIQDMDYEQLKKYLESKKTLHPTSMWNKKQK
jgi:hypothetical protein